ncbi:MULTISPECIES: thioredoxin-disulfide reductase [unclassified Facklamia]|uniref:thioredoxin-disulfide reductase n=1 Tax=Aerococcaceae TaxID=186827 RepID=UPI0013BABBFA|nr:MULTISPECIES: thioredoxin-disulfide reductase [unclassified Facklamia]MBS4462379.1 thioredoxin-disulfide reductase [Aerococcaceae bacterium zg-B36]NEW64891.1 thioredoxin-disulfide reductase [Facklamia sp. 252]NEW68213.1 thioredoxin-disulfide reductase [Facklamia sp. 253]QQD66057.1 thioredoxin-disulfide reductase [Aerococcaceae bacterium zg-252]
MSEKEQIKVDVVVIGAGPGGLTAALYASRANLKTVIIEKGMPGGEVNNTADVENYPGFKLISGPELANHFYESAMAFGAELVYGNVEQLEIDGLTRLVHTSKVIYEAKVVIVATGSHHRKLGVPGEEELSGRGVSYCAVCDGFFFRGKHVVVVGGGDSAVEEGSYLTQFAEKVTIIHRRDALRAQKVLQERAFANEKIEFVWDSVVESINGEDKVESISLRNLKTEETSELAADGAFIYVGLIPNSSVVANLGITDDEGWIVTDTQMATAIPGIFAVGDVRNTHLRQIATAVGDGSHAGHMAYQYITSLN